MNALLLLASLSLAQSTGTARVEIERAVSELQRALSAVRSRIPVAAAALNLALEDDEQVRALNAKVRELEERVSENAGEPDKKAQLEKDLSALFDAKLAVQEALAAKLTKVATELRKKVSSRRARKSELVRRRMAELSGESGDFDW